MDSFSLLKYWKGGGGAAAVASIRSAASFSTQASESAAASEEDDDGPFFDLEFAVPSASGAGDANDHSFAMASSEADLRSDDYLSIYPSDHLFYNGKLVSTAESDVRSQLSVSLLRSATRFRVFMLRLRKAKSSAAVEVSGAEEEHFDAAGASPKQIQQLSKFFVRFKVEEVPVVSLFSRTHVAEEKKSGNSKEVVQKYLRKFKPFYVRVSKRYGFSGPLTKTRETGLEETESYLTARIGHRRTKSAMSGKLRVANKNLGKSKSSVASADSPPNPSRRRDDSLLQQEDGIQSAIAHCKRSFSAAINESKSPLTPSNSGPGESCSS
ncbi:hypothetical protein HPP92_023633 [Vanilla planifolia]|uniref:Membrane-associated kinase regulator 2 n=1 Tax=Vanilla planifolia TaxID=51239 RepID=A0A835UC71_VANPL|nr:hypothetical protein HPP92_023941 [Vanilla planifolia]KAG0455845.1 hypothetical protein HPP92_023633 [Vanilla planifolia]